MGVVRVPREKESAEDGLEQEEDDEKAGVVDDNEEAGAVTADEGREKGITRFITLTQ